MNIYRNVKILTWFNFFTDFKLYSPVAIIYFAKVSNSFALGMSIFSLAMLSSAIFEVPTGVFSDMIGRKKTVMLGALTAVLYSIFYAIGQSYWFLVIGAIFEGLSRSFYSGNNDALLYDTLSQTSKKDDYHHYLGRVSSMFQIALAVSAILGGILASWSFALIMWISVIPQFICFLLSIKLIELSIHTEKSGNIYEHLKESLTNLIKNIKLRNLSLASILSFAFGEASFNFQSAFYNTVWPLWAIGIAKTLSYSGASVSYFLSGKMINKLSAIKWIIIGNVYSKIINIFSLVFVSVLSPALMSTTSLFYGVTQVAKTTLLQKEFTDKQRATMGSINSFFGSICYAFFAFLIGFVADSIGPAKSLLLITIISSPIILIYWKVFKNDSKGA